MGVKFVRAASVRDLEPGQIKQVDVEGRDICLVNWDGTFYAVSNACPHWGVGMHWGWVRDRAIMCGWHGYRYDLVTGEQKDWRDTDDLPVYPVRIKWKGVYVGVTQADPPPAPDGTS